MLSTKKSNNHPQMPHCASVQFDDIANITVTQPCRLVLRHNQNLQVGADLTPGDSLRDKMLELKERAKQYPAQNGKITGCKKLLEHTKINGVFILPLVLLLLRSDCKCEADVRVGRLCFFCK